MRRLLRPGMFGLMLLASGSGLAMSIGDIQVESGLGEPFRASIPVSLDQSVPPESDCFALTGEARRHPDLAKARVALEQAGGSHVVRITGTQPVNDPILDIALRAQGCGPTLQRDFVVLLSPRGESRPVQLPVAAPFAVAEIATPAPTVTRPPRRAQRPRPRAASAATSSLPRASAGSPRRSAGKSAPRSQSYVLRLDYGFDAFSLAAERVARQRQAEYAAGRRPAAGQPGIAAGSPPQRPAGVPLEEVFSPQARTAPAADGQPAQARAGAPASGRDVLVLQASPDAPGGTAGLAAGSDTPPSVAGGGNGQTGAGGPGLGAANGSVAGAAAVAGNPPVSAPGGRSEGDPDWAWFTFFNVLMLVAALLFAAAIALWLKRRADGTDRFTLRHVEEGPASTSDLEEDTRPHPIFARQPLSAEPTPVRPARIQPESEAAEPTGQVEKTKTPDADDIEPAALMPIFIPSDEVSLDATETPDHILELAEVMLAFGRSNEAIQTLSQYIQGHPRQAVDPWLRLLDLYRQSGLRTEFEALSRDLHMTFNVATPDWETFDRFLGQAGGMDMAADGETPAEPMSLESLQHIMARLTSIWGQPECLEYLDKLLADNRGGQRLGFAMPIVRDILLLRDMLRHINPPSTLQQSFR